MAERKITNQNVFFKSGFQSALNELKASNKIQVGTFYLTEDTNRLYVGKENNGLSLLNSSVNFITLEQFNALQGAWASEPDKGATHENELYYIIDSNILATWVKKGESYGWNQINPDTDTKITNFISEIAASGTNTVEVSNTVSASNGIAGGDINKSSAFKVKGIGKTVAVAAEADTDTITVKGDTYSMAATADGSNAKVQLTSALGQATSTVGVKAGDNVTLKVTDGNIEIASDKWVPTQVDSRLEAVDGKLALHLKEGNEGIIIESDDLYFTVGAGSGTGVTKNIPINGNLGVYTAEQIDAKIRGLNGMTYRSTVGPYNSSTVTASFYINNNTIVESSGTAAPVSNGDMFYVVCETDSNGNPIPISFQGKEVITGDLIIASGTENADGTIGADLAWTVVPSGNDTIIDTTFKFEADAVNHAITLMSSKGSSNKDVGAIDLNAGKDIVLNSTAADLTAGGQKLITTISHATVSTTTPTAETVTLTNGEADIPVVESITVDNGHVTQINTKKLTLPTYSLTQFEASNSKTTTEKKVVSLASVLKAGDSVLDSLDVSFASQTLNITYNAGTAAEGPTVNMELVWGTF